MVVSFSTSVFVWVPVCVSVGGGCPLLIAGTSDSGTKGSQWKSATFVLLSLKKDSKSKSLSTSALSVRQQEPGDSNPLLMNCTIVLAQKSSYSHVLCKFTRS